MRSPSLCRRVGLRSLQFMPLLGHPPAPVLNFKPLGLLAASPAVSMPRRVQPGSLRKALHTRPTTT